MKQGQFTNEQIAERDLEYESIAMIRIRDTFFVLTGAPGSGKSTLLQHLSTLGHQGISEPARQILAEQRRIAGNGVPERDARLFVDLMLSRMLGEYHRLEQTQTPAAPVFFDRGIPDMLGYASHFGFDYPPGQNAAREFRYNRRVFFAPAWEQIYTTDAERTLSFEVARQFGEALRDVYQQCGYDLIELPCLGVEERVRFILNTLGDGGPDRLKGA
jgi:predicted ATPase